MITRVETTIRVDGVEYYVHVMRDSKSGEVHTDAFMLGTEGPYYPPVTKLPVMVVQVARRFMALVEATGS